MKAMVATGKFKSEKDMEETVKMEKKFLSKAKEGLKNCRGGILLTHSDGTCMDISLWESEEDAAKMMEDPEGQELMKMFEEKTGRFL